MEENYMELAHKLAGQSHCLRRKVGAVLVPRDRSRILTSVNDPRPCPELCQKLGCLRDQEHIASGTQVERCRCVHCETDLIRQCAGCGVSPRGASVYTTLFPCTVCTETLIAAGVEEVIFSAPYTDDSAALEAFRRAGVRVCREELAPL